MIGAKQNRSNSEGSPYLLLLGDLLPELAGFLLQRLHPRQSTTEDRIGESNSGASSEQRTTLRTQKKKQGRLPLAGATTAAARELTGSR